MSQADGYVRIVTQNDVSEAQRSTSSSGTRYMMHWTRHLRTT